MSLTRRQMLALGAALALPALARASEDAEPGVQLGSATPFHPQQVTAKARALAAKAYQPPAKVPEAWRQLSYDQYRSIWFDTRNALWRGSGRPLQVEFFAPGLYYPAPVQIHAVANGETRPVLFDMAVFDKTDKVPRLPIDHTLGYSGLRLHGELEKPGIFQEYAVFQGASYFRGIGRGQIYGISARGLAVNTASEEGEEFREFWIERPEPGATQVVLHALLDSPSVTGAYRFAIEPGDATVMDVEATIFPRVALDNIGLAAGTSMFFYDETNRAGYEDFRPAVHDSDGLMMLNGAGEHLWRPLANPARLQVSSFVDDGPRGFGLMQRARDFGDFADLSAKYHLRPGLWVEPGENWGPGAVTLVEIPTDKEIYDNIVAYWRPRDPLPAGVPHSFSYRLNWCAQAPVHNDRARVLNTHMGRSFSGRRIAAIDFAMHDALPEDIAQITLHVSANRGQVSEGILQRNPETGGVRLDFGFTPPKDRGMEMRAQLMHELRDGNGTPLSPVWLYRWTHPA